MLIKSSQIKELFPKEEDLCRLFTQEMESLGWDVYPETAGFDLLLVWPATGQQLGVEAKLSLNAKVIDQIVPNAPSLWRDAEYGPDFRAIIVPTITESSKGLAKMLEILGVNVWCLSSNGSRMSFIPTVASFSGSAQWNASADSMALRYETAWFDFNPATRCPLPDIKPTVRAGVPSPIQLSTWKIGALRVMADLELDGFVTARSVRAHGIDPRRFCATDGWLTALGEGRWGKGKVPEFDKQHPEVYAQILEQAKAKRAQEKEDN